MQAGTTADGFLRSNLDWLQKASNWAKFSVVASTGVVHRGNVSNAMNVLATYLPQAMGVPTGSPHSEGGAFYALGLIFANRGTAAAAGVIASPAAIAAGADGADDEPELGGSEDGSGGIVEYLLRALGSTADETVLHGALLGMGIAAMGTANEGAFNKAHGVLLNDDSVSAEAAGLCIGLLLLGKGAGWSCEALAGEPLAEQLLTTARSSNKEKVVRGTSLGLAFMVFGLEEAAEPLIAEMLRDKTAAIRYGGMYALGLAYAGTGNSGALRRMLHVAVSDVADDVRRAAVTNIGFILARTPGEVPAVVAQLAESYNPHVSVVCDSRALPPLPPAL